VAVVFFDSSALVRTADRAQAQAATREGLTVELIQ